MTPEDKVRWHKWWLKNKERYRKECRERNRRTRRSKRMEKIALGRLGRFPWDRTATDEDWSTGE